MKRAYKESLERHNAPYRGASSREDVVNFDLAVMHDLFEIDKASGENEAFDGHKQFITDNLAALYHGDATAKASIPTAGKIVAVQKKDAEASDLTNWTRENSAILTTDGRDFLLDATGLLVPSGLVYSLEINPGDILQLRFRLSKLIGQETIFAFGAKNFNYTGDELIFLDLDGFWPGGYVEKRLYSQSRQTVQLVLYAVHQTTSNLPVKISLEDFSVNYLHETSVGLTGSDSLLKPELERQQCQLSFLEDRITTEEKGGGY